MSESKKHHYVTQSYIKKFNSRGDKRVYVINKRLKEKQKDFYPKPRYSSAICYVYYGYKNSEYSINGDELWMETEFGRIENEYPNIYNVLTDSNINVIKEKLKRDICAFIVSLKIRSLKLKYKGMKFFADASNLLDTITKDLKRYDPNCDVGYSDALSRIKEYRFDDDKCKQDYNIILGSQLPKQVWEYLYGFNISILSFDSDKGIIAGDNPVITYEPLLKSTDTVILPIDRKTALFLIPHENVNLNISRSTISGTEADEMIDQINKETLINSEKYIYGDRQDLDIFISKNSDQFKASY